MRNGSAGRIPGLWTAPEIGGFASGGGTFCGTVRGTVEPGNGGMAMGDGADDNGERHLVRRGSRWWYRRRVPADLADLDRRGEIRTPTKTGDRVAAAIIARRINAEVEAYWRSLSEAAARGQEPTGAGERFADALKLARQMGVTYRPAADLAVGPLPDLVERVEALRSRGAIGSPLAAAAVLGGAARPALRLSGLFAAYEQLAGDRLIGKSPDQVRKWRNPRLRAIANAISVLGDKGLAELTRHDALEFRAWWIDRVRDEGYDQGSANKDLGHIGAMILLVDESWRLGLDQAFAGVRVAGERHNPRVAYDAQFVRERIMPGRELPGLNDEARAIVVMVAATGMRPSEVAALTAARIVLDVGIPHLQIRPDQRQLKSRNAERDMPLVGAALDVMRANADGFPRYRDAPDTFSATANKALGAAGLRPTPAHTVYSLRHTFKDRLIALEAPPRVQDALMGHALGEIAYGAGPSLEQRAAWLRRVWE